MKVSKRFIQKSINNALEDKITLKCEICGRTKVIPADGGELPKCWHGETTWQYIPYAVSMATTGVTCPDEIEALREHRRYHA